MQLLVPHVRCAHKHLYLVKPCFLFWNAHAKSTAPDPPTTISANDTPAGFTQEVNVTQEQRRLRRGACARTKRTDCCCVERWVEELHPRRIRDEYALVYTSRPILNTLSTRAHTECVCELHAVHWRKAGTHKQSAYIHERTHARTHAHMQVLVCSDGVEAYTGCGSW
jgi:hypothetical protein